MSEKLKFRQFGKTKGIIIEDGTKKGFGNIQPLGKTDQAGDKFRLKVNDPKGIPLSILDEKKDKLFKQGIINKIQRDRTEKVNQKARKTSSINVKSIAEGKKLAKKLAKMFKVGGGSDFPIKLQQGPDLVKKNKGGLSTKKYANAVTMVNNLR